MLPIELLNQTSNFSSAVSKHSRSRKIEYFTISLNLRFLISVIAIFNICFPTSLLILYIKHRRKMTNDQHLSLFRCANVLWTTTVVALGPSQSITCSSLRIAPALPSFHGLRPWQELHTISFHNIYINPPNYLCYQKCSIEALSFIEQHQGSCQRKRVSVSVLNCNFSNFFSCAHT